MTGIELRHVGAEPLVDLNLTLEPGHHVLLGSPADGSAVLVQLVAGLRPPRRGLVLIGGAPPARCSALRRRLGALLAHEPTPCARTVRDWVDRALRLRHDERSPNEVLSQSGLGAWQPRRVEALNPAERRTVAMALALSVPEPAALVLFEPLGSLPGLAVEYITRRLSALAAGGACVLSMTASPADAARLSESIWLLEGGRIVRPVPCPSGVSLTPGTAPELVVRTDQPRALLAALASAPAVRAVSWNEATEVGQLRVRGEDVSQVSLAVLQAACQTGAALSTMAAVLPPLDQVRAASAGLVRGAYEHALQMARAGHTAAEAPPAPAAAATSTNDGSSQ